MKQTGFFKIFFIKPIKRPPKKLSFTLISVNRSIYSNSVKSSYVVKTSKTGIRLMQQNCPFFCFKVLPNSALSLKKVHAFAVEYGQNAPTFC